MSRQEKKISEGLSILANNSGGLEINKARDIKINK